MKERIISNLTFLSQYNPENSRDPAKSMMCALIEESELDESQVIKNAELTLQLILHQYSDFSVSTIDSFVHRIVRTFARDLLLPINFEIELDQEKLTNESIDVLIGKAGTDEELTNTLVLYSLSRAEEDKSWNIEADLKIFAKLLFQEEGQINIKKLNKLKLKDFFEINKKLSSKIKKFEAEIKIYGNQGKKLILSNHINPASFYRGASGVPNYFSYLSECLIDKLQPNSYVKDTFEQNKWFSAKVDEKDKGLIDSIKGELTDIYNKVSILIETQLEDYLINRSISGTIYQVSVLSEIGKVLDEITREQNLVHISEFNRKIAQVVMNEPAPFIYERIGEKYHSFLIDEFQDTSMLQWQNLLPLIDNALALGYPNIIVGDGKQAIYRWRNGEVEQFAVLPEIYHRPEGLLYKQREEALERNYKENHLAFNYRTRKEIVNFNNRFFSSAAKNLIPPLDRIYNNIEQKALDNKPGGYIHFDFCDKQELLNTYEEYSISSIIQQIEECLKDGYALKDIAILFRSNSNANLVARSLIKQGYDIQSNESVLLANSKVVGFLIACLRNILVKDDQIAKAVIQHFLDDISIDKRNWKQTNLQSLEQLPVYDACEEIIKRFNLYSTHNPYLIYFMDAVHEYSSSKGSSIHGFIDWWDANKNSQYLTLPEGLDAIKILTIHKSKGLEFPVVILPFANYRLKNTKDYIWIDNNESDVSKMPVALIRMNAKLEQTNYAQNYHEEVGKNILDYINMAYVAFTRPIDRLYVITEKPSKKPSGSFSLSASLFSFFKEENVEILDGKAEIGIKSKNSNRVKIGMKQSILNNIPSSDWRKKLFIRQNAPLDWNVFDPDKQRGIGNLIHKYLSLINTLSDTDRVIDRLRFSKEFNDSEIIELENAIKSVVQNDELKDYYAEDVVVMNECGILMPDGKLLRPDRIVIKNNIATIIDYKTGSLSEHHNDQILGYINLMKDMGYTNTQAYLVYLENPINVIKVS